MTEPADQGQRLGQRFYAELERRLSAENAPDLTAAELELIRKVLDSNSITLGQVKSGKFGEVAKSVAEEFPFMDGMEEGPGLQ